MPSGILIYPSGSGDGTYSGLFDEGSLVNPIPVQTSNEDNDTPIVQFSPGTSYPVVVQFPAESITTGFARALTVAEITSLDSIEFVSHGSELHDHGDHLEEWLESLPTTQGDQLQTYITSVGVEHTVCVRFNDNTENNLTYDWDTSVPVYIHLVTRRRSATTWHYTFGILFAFAFADPLPDQWMVNALNREQVMNLQSVNVGTDWEVTITNNSNQFETANPDGGWANDQHIAVYAFTWTNPNDAADGVLWGLYPSNSGWCSTSTALATLMENAYQAGNVLNLNHIDLDSSTYFVN